MPIPVKCSCGKQISAPDKLAGKRAKCPGCGEALSIPAASKGNLPAKTSSGTAIPVKCECGKSFAAPAKLAGKAVKCPACQKPIKVPGGAGQGPPAASEGGITAQCDSCGKSFRAPSKLAGKKVGCPGCKQPVQIPGGKQTAVAATDTAGLDDDIGVGSLLDEIGFQRAAAANRCPECKADLGADAILCVHCGYHLETGKKLSTHTVEKKSKKVAAPKAVLSAKQTAGLQELASRKKLIETCFQLIVVSILGNVGLNVLATRLPEATVAMIYIALIVFSIFIGLFMAFAVFRVASHLKGQTSGIVFGLLALLPCIGFLLLLWMNSLAGTALSAGGYTESS